METGPQDFPDHAMLYSTRNPAPGIPYHVVMKHYVDKWIERGMLRAVDRPDRASLWRVLAHLWLMISGRSAPGSCCAGIRREFSR